MCIGVRDVNATVTLSDGHLTVTGSPTVAKKKGQRRRPTAERTKRLVLMHGAHVPQAAVAFLFSCNISSRNVSTGVYKSDESK